jgi:hypothetical protein
MNGIAKRKKLLGSFSKYGLNDCCCIEPKLANANVSNLFCKTRNKLHFIEYNENFIRPYGEIIDKEENETDTTNGLSFIKFGEKVLCNGFLADISNASFSYGTQSIVRGVSKDTQEKAHSYYIYYIRDRSKTHFVYCDDYVRGGITAIEDDTSPLVYFGKYILFLRRVYYKNMPIDYSSNITLGNTAPVSFFENLFFRPLSIKFYRKGELKYGDNRYTNSPLSSSLHFYSYSVYDNVVKKHEHILLSDTGNFISSESTASSQSSIIVGFRYASIGNGNSWFYGNSNNPVNFSSSRGFKVTLSRAYSNSQYYDFKTNKVSSLPSSIYVLNTSSVSISGNVLGKYFFYKINNNSTDISKYDCVLYDDKDVTDYFIIPTLNQGWVVERGDIESLALVNKENTENGRLFYYFYKGEVAATEYCQNYNIGGEGFIYTDETNYYLYYKGEPVKSGTYTTFESFGESQEDMFFRIDGISYILFYETGNLVSYNI